MGRKKIDTTCKLPEAKINSTFTKRKRGAVNKVKELGKLCDVDVALIAFHPRNDAVIAVSHGGRVDEVIHKFQEFKQRHLEKVQFSEELRAHRSQEAHPQGTDSYQVHPGDAHPAASDDAHLANHMRPAKTVQPGADSMHPTRDTHVANHMHPAGSDEHLANDMHSTTHVHPVMVDAHPMLLNDVHPIVFDAHPASDMHPMMHDVRPASDAHPSQMHRNPPLNAQVTQVSLPGSFGMHAHSFNFQAQGRPNSLQPAIITSPVPHPGFGPNNHGLTK